MRILNPYKKDLYIYKRYTNQRIQGVRGPKKRGHSDRSIGCSGDFESKERVRRGPEKETGIYK